LGQTKSYNIGICCFSAKHAALRSKNDDWLSQCHDNVSEWNDMSICGLLFQLSRTLKNPTTTRVGQVQNRYHFIKK